MRKLASLAVVAIAVALGHACSEPGAGPANSVETPDDVLAEAIAFNRIRLTWTPVAGVTSYAVERRKDLTGSFTHLADVRSPVSGKATYLDNLVEPETFYGYRVRSGGQLGSTSAPSEIVGAKTPPEPGIEVTIAMTAPDPAGADPNGFRLRVTGNGSTVTSTVAAGDIALVTPLAAGSYTVTLEDIASSCGVQGGASRTVTVVTQGQTVAQVKFTVICRDASKGGIIVVATAAGDTSDVNGVIARVVGTAGTVTSIQDTLRVLSGQSAATNKLELLTLSAGSYEVSLLDVDASICSLSGPPNQTRNVIAARNDTVRFSMTCSRNRAPVAKANGPYSGMVNTPITFNSSGSTDSDGSITAYAWNFGDGTTGSGASPSHAYTTAGPYKAKLTVTDNAGATHSDSTTVTVVPGFAWKNRFSDDSIQAGTPVLLDVTTKPGPGVTAASGRVAYNSLALRLDSIVGDARWNQSFTRNGTVIGVAAFQAAASAPLDATAETQIATLHFTAIGANGALARTTTSNIILRNGGGTNLSLAGLSIVEDTVKIAAGGNRPPTAKVNATAPTGMTNTALTFTSQPGTSDPDGTIVSYAWSFGDGTTGTGPIARKTYIAAGSFKVKLTVTDNGGLTASDSTTITVEESVNVLPTADAGGPYTGIVGVPIAVTGALSKDTDGTIVRYDWQFGDGSVSSGASPQAFRTYSTAGSYILALTVIDNRGGIAFDTAKVTIVPPAGSNRPPVAEANGPYSGTVGLPVSLKATGTTDPDNNIKSYVWHYPDQTTTTGFNTVKSFATAGVHRVILIVTDSMDLVDSDTASVVVTTGGQLNQLPIAEANGPYITRTGIPVAFSSIGTHDPDGVVVSYRWTFGDGTSSTDTTLSSPTKIYGAAGIYSVSLLVTDNRGGTAVDVSAVTVLQGIPPVAHSGGPYTGTTGNAVAFSASRSVDVDGTIVSYSWNFGDGTATATGLTTTHAYQTAGSYTVRLTATDNHGLTDTHSSTVTITGPPVNKLPVAKANGPYTGVSNIPISFSGAGSTDPDGTIATYAWSFGDNTTGTGQNVTHAYTAGGQFMVILTVTDDRGGIDTDTAQVTVTAAPPNVPPVAKANGPYTGAAGTPVSFNSTGSTDTDGQIVSFSWNFGDGGFAFGPNVTHTYAGGGVYTVKLTVTDNQGATAIDSARVTVSGASNNLKPIPKVNGPYTGTVGTAVSFSSAGSTDPDGIITSYAWNFGDNTTGTGPSPTHVYGAAQTYTVTLTVTDNLGATETATTQVVIGVPGQNADPVANAGGPYSGVVNIAITLAGSGTDDGAITGYAWDFDGDGFDDGNTQNPQFTCSTVGTVTIRLQVTDNGSPAKTGIASTTVVCAATGNPPPTANAGGPYNGVVGGPAVQLAGSGTDNTGIASYAWDLDNDGDFDDSALQNPTFTCSAAGANTVRLRVTDTGTPPATGVATATVTCTAGTSGPPAQTTIKGRWVNAAGAEVTSVTVGSTVFFEIDVYLKAGEDVHDAQINFDYASARLTAATTSADLNCSAPGGQSSCPSGTPPSGNTDVMNQYTGNSATAGRVTFLNFSNSNVLRAGVGIQGLAKLQFTATTAGTVTPTMQIIIFVNEAGADLNPVISLKPLTIN